MKNVFFILTIVCPFLVEAQVITTFAGTNICGHSGDGGAATIAQLENPTGGVFDHSGNYYFAERLANRVCKISSIGIITTIAGNGTAGFFGDGGPASIAELNQPGWVAIDAMGNIFITDLSNNRIRKVDTSGIIHSIAGTGGASYSGDGGPATNASLWAPNCVCVDDSGNVYDIETTRIRRINKSGIINTVVGNGFPGFSGDGGLANAAEIQPFTAFIDTHNNIYVADAGNNRIRKVNAISDIITTVAGNGDAGSGGDGGQATDAVMNPFCVTVDTYGNLFIADGPSRIRKVDATGYISTFAGTGVMGYSGDGGSATAAQIYNPEGIAIDTCGDLYIADEGNCRIRKVSFPYCGYLGVNDLAADGQPNIYPNPATDLINVKNQKTASSYSLLSITGKEIQRGELKEGNNSIPMQELTKGMYLLEITDEYGNKMVKKIMKE